MTNTLDELERSVERLNSAVERLTRAVARASGVRAFVDEGDLSLLLSERAELLAANERMRKALEGAAGTLDHVDDALTDMADNGAVPAFGTWRFVIDAAKRARAALTTGEEK